MGTLEELKGERVHTRSIRIDTHSASENRVIVEGTLEDTRPLPFYNILNERREPGTVHRMVVRLLIGDTPTRILDASAEMNTFPMEACQRAVDSVKRLVGMELAYGFSKAVKDRLSGPVGCSHLTSLILTLGSAAVQGMAAHRRQGHASGEERKRMLEYVKDTCCAWRNDGESYRRVREVVDSQRD